MNKGSFNFRRSLISFLIIGIFVVFIFPILVKQIKIDPNRYISNFKKEFRGVVKKSEPDFRGAKLITFENGVWFSISSYYESDTVKDEQLKLKKWYQNTLNELLQPGDSLFKTKNSDTILVYRNGIEYTFINRHSSSNNIK